MDNINNTTQTEQARLAELIATQLPGWKLSSKPRASTENAGRVKDRAHVKPVGSLDALRAKYLTPSAANVPQTLLVEPIGGGPAKVADYKNGVVTIVQG